MSSALVQKQYIYLHPDPRILDITHC